MSAYIVVEGTPRDKEALDRYASKAMPLIKAFGGEVIVFGPWDCSSERARITTA